jgi:hypothetical protein
MRATSAPLTPDIAVNGALDSSSGDRLVVAGPVVVMAVMGVMLSVVMARRIVGAIAGQRDSAAAECDGYGYGKRRSHASDLLRHLCLLGRVLSATREIESAFAGGHTRPGRIGFKAAGGNMVVR